MPRPTRIDEAKDALRSYYERVGAMPSIQVFAELMGYRSPSSAHDLTTHLVASGFLSRDERGGRLLPGPQFDHVRAGASPIPKELLELLPPATPWELFEVPDDGIEGVGLLPGDHLVLAPPVRTDLSATLLLERGRRRCVASEPRTGWRVIGVVVAQFRSYR